MTVRKRGRGPLFTLGWTLLAAFTVLALLGVRRSNELELTIRFDDADVYQGEYITMRLAVENVSGRLVRVDKWTSAEPEECVAPKGLPLILSLYYGNLTTPKLQLPPEPGDLGQTVLLPGEKMKFSCNLAQLFAILKPGKYVLEGSYLRDRWARRSWLAPVARLWGSRLDHEPIEINVTARRYDDPDKM